MKQHLQQCCYGSLLSRDSDAGEGAGSHASCQAHSQLRACSVTQKATGKIGEEPYRSAKCGRTDLSHEVLQKVKQEPGAQGKSPGLE